MSQSENLLLKLCRKCQNKFDTRKMWLGEDYKYYCRKCFEGLYDAASGDRKPSEPQVNSSDKFIPSLEMYYRKEGLCLGRKTRSLSKRHIYCPKADCSKFISLFSLESHFKYEHHEVPIICKQLGERSSIQFDPLDVRFYIMQCIVLLNVVNHDFSDILSSTSEFSEKNPTELKPVMVLLVTRLSGCHFNQFEEGSESTDQEESNSSLKDAANNSIFRPGDKIIIWLSSNINTNLSYTVAVSTLTNNIRQKFFGPILPLGDNPVEICRSGNCLILTHHHVNTMTENGSVPLSLDFVIHSPD